MSRTNQAVARRGCHADVTFCGLTIPSGPAASRSSRSHVKNSPATRAKDTLPIKPVLEELAFLRRTFREVLSHYSASIEGEIAHIANLVTNEGEEKKTVKERAHELRDILMLLRSLDVKPDKGRRRDLKKIETLLEDLRTIVERW